MEPSPVRRARDLVGRLGGTHRLRIVVDGMALMLSCYVHGGPTDRLVEVSRVVVSSAMRRSPVALNMLAVLALAHGLGGGEGEGRRPLAGVVPVLERIEPATYMHSFAVTQAAAAAWVLDAPALAGGLCRMLLDLIAMGVRDPMCGSLSLSAARMAALLGDMPQAEAHFARARAELEASGGHLMRAMADFDEARALTRAGARDRARIAGLLESALASFRALGMEGWAERAACDLERLRPAGGAGASARRPYPDGLTAREAEVLRLVAAGHGNREIADALTLTINTVERHIANIYAKIGARNRANATAYALRHRVLVDADA